MATLPRWIGCCLALGLVACGPDAGSNNGDGTNNETNGGGTNNVATNNGGGNNGGGTNDGGGTNNGGAAIAFTSDIAPIFLTQCNLPGCHAAPNTSAFVIDGDDAAAVRAALEDVPSSAGNQLITPNDPTASETYIRVAGLARTQMPLGGQLEEADVALIEAWIEAGAPFED